ncbi:hypothetical protein P2318_08690 [Myxococcaceae bacterium GXIMD 01537]
MNRSLALLLALALAGCAHTKKSALEDLKPVVDGFHQRIRWKDFRGAARAIVPERRDAFEKARRDLKDEDDLSVTDYEIEDVKVSPDGQRAQVISRIQWMRLPSVSAKTATVTSEFIYRDGAWMLERQLDGPFAGELP